VPPTALRPPPQPSLLLLPLPRLPMVGEKEMQSLQRPSGQQTGKAPSQCLPRRRRAMSAETRGVPCWVGTVPARWPSRVRPTGLLALGEPPGPAPRHPRAPPRFVSAAV
jgi:hypothetical protein